MLLGNSQNLSLGWETLVEEGIPMEYTLGMGTSNPAKKCRDLSIQRRYRERVGTLETRIPVFPSVGRNRGREKEAIG
jgi:hypothetical protein